MRSQSADSSPVFFTVYHFLRPEICQLRLVKLRPAPFLVLLLAAAAGGYFTGKACNPSPSAGLPVPAGEPLPARALLPGPASGFYSLAKTGSDAVPEILAALDQASPAGLRRMAEELLGDPRRRRDQGLWAPLLAKWSELDGAGLVAFARALPPADRGWLEGKAWYTWGASNPAAASAAGGTLPKTCLRELIQGMSRKDPQAALDFALRMPEAQMNVWLLSDALKALPPERLESLLPRAIYDGMRMPLRAARAAALVETDPSAALAATSPQLGHDGVPATLALIAEKDPAKARELLSAMPSSRSRALSSLSLARTWAAQDSGAALTWARRDLQCPVRQAALLEIAAVSGGSAPAEALALVEEAGWTGQGNFGAVRGGNHIPVEAAGFPSPVKTAGLLLQQLQLLDAEMARQYLRNRVPEEYRAQVAKKAGMTLEP